MSGILADSQIIQNVWVVFTGQTDRSWLKVLKPGFRHCFVVMNDGHRWLSYDPMLHYTDVRIHHHVPPEFDLAQWLEQRGDKVLKARLCRNKTLPAPFSFFTCVEAVKRFLGIHAVAVFTPWQLYRYLNKINKQGDSSWEA